MINFMNSWNPLPDKKSDKRIIIKNKLKYTYLSTEITAALMLFCDNHVMLLILQNNNYFVIIITT